jgi:hypothetical protein
MADATRHTANTEPPAPLSIAAIPRRSGITLCCAGSADASNVGHLEGALIRAIRSGFPMVEVDLEEVSFRDDSACEALRTAERELGLDGRTLRVWTGPLEIRSLEFTLMGPVSAASTSGAAAPWERR